jgi:hypothetical protein
MQRSPSREANSHSTIQEILRLFGTRRFIIIFKRARHWSVSWVTWIQSTSSNSVRYYHELQMISEDNNAAT